MILQEEHTKCITAIPENFYRRKFQISPRQFHFGALIIAEEVSRIYETQQVITEQTMKSKVNEHYTFDEFHGQASIFPFGGYNKYTFERTTPIVSSDEIFNACNILCNYGVFGWKDDKLKCSITFKREIDKRNSYKIPRKYFILTSFQTYHDLYLVLEQSWHRELKELINFKESATVRIYNSIKKLQADTIKNFRR